MAPFVEAFLELGLLDLVDILLVTTLVYAAIVLVRHTQAAFVAIGILMLGALYIAARALDLRLTAWIFQGFFAVFLVIIVVIFQEELRQLFERVAMWSLRRSGSNTAHTQTSDVLVKCLVDFARDRIGALVIIPGDRPIDRYTQGGIDLGGVLSLPLLKSLFDPHSPGHDGAVIADGDRISRFAVHLPLSKDFQQLLGVGTRHAAALGLAERTDALCLVVSEERGRISVAKDGQLRALDDPQEVGAVIHEFLREKRRVQDPRGLVGQMLRENWVEKLMSFALVVALWYLFVPGSRPAVFSYDVPVKVINLPDGYETEEVNPPEVTLRFHGIRRAFYLFDPQKLEVTLDASLARVGRRTFTITDQNVRYPKDLTLEELKPAKVRISLRKSNGPSEQGG
jgi:diadenylate cyclase